ncbi:hypothetical protein, partial [Sulfurihydrogenibium subterraneum]|uniref:hypothetical protein n=1 Tax=Sulfurihydrogenibium subterraneum TaxID=171121 RepID=UPI0005607DA1
YCNNVNNTTSVDTETNPVYTKTKTETVVGEGTDKIMCAVSTNRDEFAWIEYKGSGLYNGDYTNDVNNDTTANTVTIRHLIATNNSMIFRDTANNNTFYECTFGTNFAGGQTCAKRTLSKNVYYDVYSPGWIATTTLVKIKSDTNVLSDGAQYNYLGNFAGAAPNIKAAYFTTTVSAPYTADIQTGVVDSSTLNIPFTSAGASARGGNVSLGLNKVAHVYSPVGGTCISAGLYDNVWYKDATNNFQTLSRPNNTCLIRALQVK